MRARSAPVALYIQTAIFWGRLHMHQGMVYTTHFLFFLGPNRVVVYIEDEKEMQQSQ